ncbi:3-oxoacyl-reductase [Achaetomium macrosporum]|uniref:3-oxoacyl-reductase n=1 Tax=Achaetomium macrosporum TaxID=79813 RepID=A0AAN7C9B3_9PEZI|nr:3-oxoacyl-reductase [Achaetomium macrosporum]
MSRPLEGKLGIVTGASRGIGAAIAENLASKGCNVVINYTSASSTELATSVASQLSSKHKIRAVPIQADIGTPTGPSALISTARDHFTDPDTKRFQIDIIINNAGIARNALLPSVTIDDFESTYRVNVLGPLLVVQAAQPYLPQDRSGRIVNISSVSSSTGFVTQSVYGGTKAALEAMTRTWARELAENATVNAVNPGPVEGPMYASNTPEFLEGIHGWVLHTPLMKAREGVDSEDVVREAKESGGRPARTTEVAGIVGMLCSEEAGWCTGQVVCANGGMVGSKMVSGERHIMATTTTSTSPAQPPPASTTSTSTDPFDTLLTLEDQFYTEGYNQGLADGAVAGRTEGRQLGLERGFQKFLESGRLQGRTIVWANRLPSNGTTSEGGVVKLPPLPDNARLEKHITTLYALVEAESLSTENTDEAVNDFDDRLRRAQGRAKVIERMGSGPVTR